MPNSITRGARSNLSWLCLLPLLNACVFSGKTTKKLFNNIENRQFDMVIIPGVPFENGKWSRTMKARVYWSKYLYEKGIAKNIMYSGGAVYTAYYEGKIMALYAAALGIPAAHIYTEDLAEHSTENIYYAYKKTIKLGFTTVALASDPFQTKLLRGFIRKKLSRDIGIIPFVADTLAAMAPGMADPNIDERQAFKPGFVSIKKRQGIWKRWRGTRGKNINVKAYE